MQVYTVRNAQGQYLGDFRAKTDKQAIQRFLDSQNTLAATFRKSMSVPVFVGLKAKVESVMKS